MSEDDPEMNDSNASKNLDEPMTSAKLNVFRTSAPNWINRLRFRIRTWLKSGWSFDKDGKLVNIMTQDLTYGDYIQTRNWLPTTYQKNFLVATKTFTTAADGSLASTELLPAFATGKNVIVNAALNGPGTGYLTLSDSCGVIGSGSILHGPVTQGTSNTAVNISSAAGELSNSTKYAMSVQYYLV